VPTARYHTGAHRAGPADAERLYVESFHGRFRDEYLNANWFVNMVDAKEKIECPGQLSTTANGRTAIWISGRH